MRSASLRPSAPARSRASSRRQVSSVAPSGWRCSAACSPRSTPRTSAACCPPTSRRRRATLRPRRWGGAVVASVELGGAQGAAVLEAARTAYVDGLHAASVAAAAMLLGGAVVALATMPRREVAAHAGPRRRRRGDALPVWPGRKDVGHATQGGGAWPTVPRSAGGRCLGGGGLLSFVRRGPVRGALGAPSAGPNVHSLSKVV